jgi:hypothetical protein
VHSTASREYRRIIDQARRQGNLDSNPEQVARIDRIGHRLIDQTGDLRPGAPSWEWEIHIIDRAAVNAWAMPGGKIVVYTGLLDRIKPIDNEIASLIGHEIAHALREHGAERISEQLTTGLILDVAVSVLGIDERYALIADLLTDVVFTLPHSRQHELEADALGLELAARAGFNPTGGVSLWRKMTRKAGGSWPEFLSTHPSHTTRIRELSHYAQEVMPLYEAAPTRLARSTPTNVRPPDTSPRPTARGPATLSVATHPLATILVNGERMESNPVINHVVRPGPVRLQFEVNDNSAGRWQDEMVLEITPGEHRNLGRIALTRPAPAAVTETAFLTVGTRPLSVIYVNGERAQGNPLVNYEVPAGSVQLRFEVSNEGLTWYDELEVTLTAGNRRNLGRLYLERR